MGNLSALKVASSSPSHTTLEVRWRGNDFALQLRLLPTYPESAPIFLGIDALSFSLQDSTKQIIELFRETLTQSHKYGQGCLLEVLQTFEDGLRWLQPLDTKDPANDRRRLSNKRESAEMEQRPRLVNVELLTSSLECSVCLENVLGRDMAILDCGHALCTD